MVDATRQGALQGGIGSMHSVAAVFGPLIAAQSLAWGARHGFDGAAFLVAGGLIGMAMLIILLGVRFPQQPRATGP
jgi:DHA1 family tetracycline resistance protein-like MFS transporter